MSSDLYIYRQMVVRLHGMGMRLIFYKYDKQKVGPWTEIEEKDQFHKPTVDCLGKILYQVICT